MDMEDGKVADMVFMIPNENFADVNVATGDTNGDDVRGNDWWCDLVAKFPANASGAT